MNHVCQEIATYYVRSCERLLSREGMLTEGERSLLEYYLNILSREFLSEKPTEEKPTERLHSTAPAPVKPSPTT